MNNIWPGSSKQSMWGRSRASGKRSWSGESRSTWCRGVEDTQLEPDRSYGDRHSNGADTTCFHSSPICCNFFPHWVQKRQQVNVCSPGLSWWSALPGMGRVLRYGLVHRGVHTSFQPPEQCEGRKGKTWKKMEERVACLKGVEILT